MSDDPRWLELSIETDAELAEAISEAIFPYVEGGVALEQLNRRLPDGTAADRWEDEQADGPVVVRAYLPDDETLKERRHRIEQALFYLNMIRPVPQPTYRTVARSDWADAWRASFRPLRLGKRIIVRPSWIDEAFSTGDDIVITLDPGMAFGTGLHPTTQLCAMALEDYVRPGMRVLDVGSGSGILSILAAKLGAREVLGVDTDDEAVRVGRDNVISNGVADRVTIASGSHEAAAGGYDLVVANILAGVIVRMLSEGLAARAPLFILSGILEGQATDVAHAARSTGLTVLETRAIDDWVCLVCARTDERRT
ncbi:MAG: 50S ribosomal protein L11 methyltransferase [Anaerolineae bacterium]|nr:50S ribosomal protein L11 methyltransferase [Anaerolineae bacterium]